MEEEERKQKLKAGKEKLAEFQKKKKSKKRKHLEDEQQPNHEETNRTGLCLAVSPGTACFESDIQSFSSLSEEDFSGTEEEEPGSRSLLLVKTQLLDRTQRVAELEENLVGKQLALDKVIKENEKLRQEIAESKTNKVQGDSHDESQSLSDSGSSNMPMSQSADISRDQSVELSVNQSVGNQDAAGTQMYTMSEVQELIQHVQWLQIQLKQAGSQLQEQNGKQAATTEALQQAHSEILSLQENMVTKDGIVKQLADKLTAISAEYGILKASVTVKRDNIVPNGQIECERKEDISISNIDGNAETEYMNQIDKLTKELVSAKEKADLERADLMKALSIVKENSEVTMDENQHLKNENKRLNEMLKAISSDKERIEDSYDGVKLKLDDLLSEVENVKLEKGIIEQEKLKVFKQNASLINERDLFETTNSSMALEIQDLQNKEIAKVEELKQLSYELNKMREESEILEASKSSMAIEICELKNDKTEANKDLQYMSEELNETKEMNKALKGSISELHDQLGSIKQENCSYRNDKESFGAEIEILKSQCQTQSLQISDYQTQIEDYENKISEASDVVEENHSLRTQNDELYNKINNQKDIIAALKAETEGIIHKNMQLVEQIQALTSGEEVFRHDIEILQQEKAGIEHEVENMREQLLESQEENNNCKKVINMLNLEKETLKQELISYSVECEKYKDRLESMISNTQVRVNEECFLKEIAPRSESWNQKSNQTLVPDSFDGQFRNLALVSTEESTFVSAEESILAPVDLALFEAPELSRYTEVKDSIEITQNNVSSNSRAVDSNAFVEDLQKENEKLKNEIMRLQTGYIVRPSLELEPALVLSETEHAETQGISSQCQEQKPCGQEYSQFPSVSDICHNDTAYQTYDPEELEKSGNGAMVTLSERLLNLQHEYDRVNSLLTKKEYECELLKKELDMQEQEENITVDASHTDSSKVSEVHRIDAPGMEVNLHASSALPKTLGFGSIVPPVGATVDNVFQTCSNPNHTMLEDGGQDSICLQKEIDKLKRDLMRQSQGKSELLAVLEKEKKKLNFAICERDEFEELAKKYSKDLENEMVVKENMKDTVMVLENKIQDLNHNNEKLDWYKNELELKVNSMEKEMHKMKLEKSSIEIKEEQVRDELNRVKERLDYLESSELDIFEMRDVIDSIQAEKENILKDNEKLKNLIILKEQESEAQCQDIELLHQQYITLSEQHDVSKHENGKVVSQLDSVTSELDKLKVSSEELKQHNLKLIGEKEGLVEENLTMKTKIHTFEAETQNLREENEVLQSYFPDIDSKENQSPTLDENYRNLEKQLQEVTENNEKMVIEVTEIEEKLVVVADENETLLNKCDEMSKIIADMDNEKTDLLQRIEDMNMTLNHISDEKNIVLQKKDVEIDTLVEENSTLKTQVNSMKEDLKEIQERQSIPETKNVEFVENKIARLQDENEIYQKKVITLEQDLLELVEQIQLYDDTLSEKADLASRLELEINSLLEENSTLKTKNNILQHDLSELSECQNKTVDQQKDHGNIVDSTEAHASNKDLIGKLELEIKYKVKLQRDLEMAQGQIEENITKLKCLEDENEALGKELNWYKDYQIEKEKYIECLENDKETMLSEKGILKDELICAESNQKVTMKQVQCLTADLQTCQLHLQSISDNRNHIRSQIEILSAEIETLSASRDASESRYISLANKYAKLKCKSENATALVESLGNENRALKSENEKYSQFLENVQERVGKLDKIIDKNEELASRNDSLSEKIDTMEVQVEKVKKEKIELEKLLEELTNMLHDMQTKYEEVKSEMEATKKKCDKEIKQLQTQLQTMNDDVQELRNMLDIMENEVYDVNEEKLVLKENLQQRENQFEEAVERKQKLEEMLSEKHQKDVQNKRTACEQLTNRTNDTESSNISSETNLCEMCRNELTRSSVSTVIQTDIAMTDMFNYPQEGPECVDFSNIIPTQSALNKTASSFDSDKDEDTKDDTNSKIMLCNADIDLHQSGSADLLDYKCQVPRQEKLSVSKLTQSEVEVNFSFPSKPGTVATAKIKCQSLPSFSPVSGEINTQDEACIARNVNETQDVTENFEFAQISNIPARNIACEMIKNEKNDVKFEQGDNKVNENKCQSDQIVSDSVIRLKDKEQKTKTVDIGLQTNIMETASSMCELCIERSSNTSDHADLSVFSVDSGVFSAVTGPKFSFDTPTDLSGHFKQMKPDSKISGSEILQNKLLNSFSFASTQTEVSHLVEYTDICCQTDNIEMEDIEKTVKELQEKYETMQTDLETQIEDRLKKKLDFREQKIKLQEEQYEQKIKQIEYEIEEKYENNFRMREAEIVMKAEFVKKSYEKEIEDMANCKIEQIRMQKDQQFVETMQKVRSDLKRRHKAEIAKLKGELQAASDIGPGGDISLEQNTQQNLIQKLNEENKDLATARDALLRRSDSSRLQALHLDLQNIMGDERIVDVPQSASLALPSWLNWEISPELSFGSLNSSIDEKSLSGSLDPNSFCTNTDCLSVRMKYEQLVERIKKFLAAKRSDSSFSDTSTPRADVSDTGKNEVFMDKNCHDTTLETDRFVENTEPEIPMLQRITSIHLEHSVRMPCTDSEALADGKQDQFVMEDVTSSKDIDECILKHIILESEGMNDSEESKGTKHVQKKKLTGDQSKFREVEGHFSENESESETEEFSEGSVTIDYDQFESFNSESGMRVTDKNIHPFDECKFSKSVIRRHMSESELSDEDELDYRKRCFSDSGITSDNMLVNAVIVKEDKSANNSEGLFVHENKETDTLNLSEVSGFETINDEVLDDTDRSSVSEIIPSENVEEFVTHQKIEFKPEQDKFIAEMSPLEEKSAGSAVLEFEKLNNEKAMGEDSGDFFEERSVVRKKNGRQLMELNFKFQSYSLDNEELKEILEPKIIPLKKLETSVKSFNSVNTQDETERIGIDESYSELSLHEELKLGTSGEVQNLFVNEDEKLDSADILENISMDPLPVSDEHQSYENTVFDVLNSICPGTNPVRTCKDDIMYKVFQTCEHTGHDLSNIQNSHDIEALHSQIQNLESELSTLKTENLHEQCRECEKLQLALLESKQEINTLHSQNVETCEELEKVVFLKESLELQIKKFRNENESLLQVNLKSQEQIQNTQIKNEELKSEVDKMEKLKIDRSELAAGLSEIEIEKQALVKTLSDLKEVLDKQEKEIAQVCQEKNKATCDMKMQENNFEIQRQEYEAGVREMTIAKQTLEQKFIFASNRASQFEKDKIELEEQVHKMDLKCNDSEMKMGECNEQLLSLKQNNNFLTAQLECLVSENKVEKEHLNNEIKTLKDENASFHKKANELNCLINQINLDNETLTQQFDVKMTENKQFYTEIQTLRSVVEELHDMVSESDKTNKCLVDETRRLETETSSLKESYKGIETEKLTLLEKIDNYKAVLQEHQSKTDMIEMSLQDKKTELEFCKQKISEYEYQIDSLEKEIDRKMERSDKCTETESDEASESASKPLSDRNEEINLLSLANDNLKHELKKAKEINEENEWAMNELASQVDQLEKNNKSLSEKLEHINSQYSHPIETSKLERNQAQCDLESNTEDIEVLRIESQSKGGLKLSEENFKIILHNLQDEKESIKRQMEAKYEVCEEENKTLFHKVQSLEKEKLDLNVLIKYNRETFEKEKTELLDMYNDLKNEVDTLIETKKYLEDELCTLKELLESGIDLKERDTTRELTVEDLEEMEELKESLEHLKTDMKEKDNYVRKLEEHLLNLDKGLPDLSNTPKPRMSSGEPVISKAFSHKRQSFQEFGRMAYSLDRSHQLPSVEKQLSDRNSENVNLDNSDHSTISESKFLADLHEDGNNPFRSSVHSDFESVPSLFDSFDASGKILSGLKADEDGHYALELKQFELVDEISKFRKDFHETKAIYEQETVLLTEALEREKAVTESLKTKKTEQLNEKGDSNVLVTGKTLATELVRARQDISLLRRENNILRIENERWLSRIKEQEKIVLDLRERLARNTSGIEEIEEVFGKQLALLQKQREELLDQLRDRDQENSRLSVTLGEKVVIEDSLRREKEILSAKLQEKANLEKELQEKQMALEKQKLLQKQFEEVVYQKDLNERNLMKQKRLLEEELLEIESKFRDREENLGYEKNQLLDELREKYKKQKSDMCEIRDEVQSDCSDSSVSDQQIGRLELMLEEVEKQHKRAVKILRDQLESKYNRRERVLKGEHSVALRDLHLEQKKQVK